MDETDDRDGCNGDASGEPLALVFGVVDVGLELLASEVFLIAAAAFGGAEKVGAEGNRVGGGDGEEDELHGEDAGCQVSWPLVDALEVDFFAAGAGEGGAVF